MPPKKEKFYCGDDDDIPKKYKRRGSRYECLRKGVGVGLYVLGNGKKKSKKKSEKQLLKEEKRKDKGKDKLTKKEFKNFLDDNWETIKNSSKKNRDVFYKLAKLYAENE